MRLFRSQSLEQNAKFLSEVIELSGKALSDQIRNFKALPQEQKKLKIRLMLFSFVGAVIIVTLFSLVGCSSLPQDMRIDGLSVTTSTAVPLLKPIGDKK